MVDQTRSGLIPCAAYCKSANTVFPQSIQCNVQEKTDLCLNGRPGRYGTEKLTRSGGEEGRGGVGYSTCTPSASVHIPIHLRVYMWTSSEGVPAQEAKLIRCKAWCLYTPTEWARYSVSQYILALLLAGRTSPKIFGPVTLARPSMAHSSPACSDTESMSIIRAEYNQTKCL